MTKESSPGSLYLTDHTVKVELLENRFNSKISKRGLTSCGCEASKRRDSRVEPFFMAKYKLRTQRPGWYWIDKAALRNFGLCPVGVTIYNDISANVDNQTQRAYFALNAFCRNFGVGKEKAAQKFEELQDKGLFRVVGRNGRGCPVVELLEVDKIAKHERKARPVPTRTGPTEDREPLTGSKPPPPPWFYLRPLPVLYRTQSSLISRLI